MSVVIPVILCGGSGTRLWPLSRSDRPKQLVSLFGDHTLLEGTLLRARSIAGAGDPICVTAAAYGAEVRHSLERLDMRGRLLLEPEPRNTAPALCAAALLAVRSDPQAVIVALPADHVIEDGGAFAASVALAVAATEGGWLTILGLRPRHASFGLGYIVPGAAIEGLPEVRRVSRFVEKPDAKRAGSLIAAGALWNAGIVVARADTVIDAMRKHEPAVLDAVERSLAAGVFELNDVLLNADDFAEAPRISFDKAVLERHEAVAVTALDSIWRDVGTWAEVAELYSADEDGNRQNGRANLTHSHDSFVFSPHRMIVGIGLRDLLVVDTPDAVLVANRNSLGRLSEVVEAMKLASSPEVSSAPDGAIAKDSAVQVFHVSLLPGERLARKPHADVSCHWTVLEGTVQATISGEGSTWGENQTIYVPSGTSLALDNSGIGHVRLIELRVMQNSAHNSDERK
ncbi:MAG: NTP transferase domain-containing protein [Hyphomicrobiales bacterium]|nr:NTP transferase domain-containing protein [Hyphomicrobiales bacterium]